ncbi:MAG: 16S rRNA (guanine(966)-N(2))-methyltransferase RsmD [Actinomycetales bacterium]|nr:16S rRNA (guanine(966)-N(2))-methyltransferase RsmD [Actinomycetales bacterium]
MTRIIAGRAGGRRLQVPKRGTRPTTDRVREAIFSTLDSQLAAEGAGWSGVQALDLFAGSGALGLEALSRGAASVLFVERHPEAARILAANVSAVDLPGAAVLRRDAFSLVKESVPACVANLCLVDPPYDLLADQVADLLTGLLRHGWLQPDCLVVVEASAARAQSPFPGCVQQTSRRVYGDTAVWYGRIASVKTVCE